MKYIFYYYNNQGALIFDYSDNGKHIDQCYIGYSLREAISRFRKRYNLQYKHIEVIKLY